MQKRRDKEIYMDRDRERQGEKEGDRESYIQSDRGDRERDG